MRRAPLAAAIVAFTATAALGQSAPIPECQQFVSDRYTYQACVMLVRQQQKEKEDQFRKDLAEQERARAAAERKAAWEREKAKYDAEAAQYARDAAAREAYYDRLPETHAAEIRKLKAHIRFVRQQMARERRIGAMSGFVNAQLMYQSAQAIEIDEAQIARRYRRYREVGGRKPLSAL